MAAKARRSGTQAAGGRGGSGRGAVAGSGQRPARAAAGTSLYAEVTARIVAELEAGRFPWVQPWGSTRVQQGLPRNAATGRPYSGINVLILWGAAIQHGYDGQGWLTFRQALASGGTVRKGEHGTCVCYADRFTPERERAEAQGATPGSIAFLKRFTVFNVDQIDWPEDARPRFAAEPVALPEREIVPLGEALIAATGADFRIGGDRAFYAPGGDYVQVPPQPAFRHQIDYYRTATHELGHWTGHRSRLDRDQSGAFGSAAYAREELVAELSAAFVCASLGIVPSVRHADYLGGWLDLLRADNRAIFKAASLAARAADHLLGCLGQREPAVAALVPGEAMAA